MAAWISADTAWAQDCGRRDRGATAGSPPARYRATSLVTQALETPALLATSRWLRPSPTTASMTYRSTPMAHLQWWAVCPETCRSRGGHYVVKPDTTVASKRFSRSAALKWRRGSAPGSAAA